MPDFRLYRVQAHLPPDPRLPLDGVQLPGTSSTALSEAIFERPTAQLRRGHEWHIGNITRVDEGGIAFALGRTTKTTIEQFDPQTGDFIDTESENAPYTHAVADLLVGVVGIASKRRLGNTDRVASYLERLLNASQVARRGRIAYTVAAIADPDSFIRHIKLARAVKSFTFTFGQRNALDVEKLIVRPTQLAAEELGGTGGSLAVQGYDLDRDKLEDVSRSVAALGQDARAVIDVEDSATPVHIRLGSDAVLFRSEEPETEEAQRAALRKLRQRYLAVRSRE